MKIIVISIFILLSGCSDKKVTKTTPADSSDKGKVKPLSKMMKEQHVSIPNKSGNRQDIPKAKPAKPKFTLFPVYKKGDHYVSGSKSAPIKVKVFLDLQCPFCAMMYGKLYPLMKKNSDVLSVEIINFPLRFHKNAIKFAKMSLCAGDKYFLAVKKLFGPLKNEKTDIINKFILKLQLDKAKFLKCYNSYEVSSIIARDQQIARSKKVRGTPTIFIDGQRENNWSNAIKKIKQKINSRSQFLNTAF